MGFTHGLLIFEFELNLSVRNPNNSVRIEKNSSMKNDKINNQKNHVKRYLLASTLVFLLLSGCALLKGKKEIVGLKFSYAPTAVINYGSSFSIKTKLVYENGKEKDITDKKDLSITVTGGIYRKGKISIGGHPETLRSDTVHIRAVYTLNDKEYKLSESIPFNYNGTLILKFKGENGANGADGDNKGTPVILRNGKTGGEGLIGGEGGIGQDLSVNIWKEITGERYRISATNLITNKTYQYTFKDKGFGIRFDVGGGSGGIGGDGGKGGNGKDGIISEKKTKTPGDGGNGGNGGNGGFGGSGGTVYIFIHPNAAELKNKIAVYNSGGLGGAAGNAGKAGNAGEPAGGQDQVPDGIAGIDGIAGEAGQTGSPFEVVVEDFDIEN
ncbi:MAG: hypothetical protein ACI8ZM_003106 [Crocinitomix sp.]|jgi:hypothetical protein